MVWIEPAEIGFKAPDWEGINGELQVGKHDDGTATVTIRGKRGRVFGWVEISKEDVDRLKNYL